jgi:hypothetical protein
MEAAKPLNYAPKSSAPRKFLRRSYILISVIGIVAVAIFIGPRTWYHIRTSYWLQRCLDYEVPSNTVVLELNNRKIIQSNVPEPQRELQLGYSVGTIFLHKMIAPHGSGILIELALQPSGWYPPNAIYCLVTHPCDLNGNLLLSKWDFPAFPQISDDHHWKFFAGQPDPANPSHFTFDYELDGNHHTCDAWLKNEGNLVISQRP